MKPGPKQSSLRRICHLTAKDLLQARRDKLAFLFTLVLPVIFTVFLGLLIGGQSQSAGLPLAVANEDRGPAAQQLLQQLEAVTALKLEPKALTDCEQAVKKQEVAAALIIPAGFSAKVAANEHSSLTFVRLESLSAAQTVREAVESALRTFNSTRLVASVATEQTAAALGQVPNDELLRQAQDLAADVLAKPVVQLSVQEAGTAVPRHANGFDQSSPGQIVNWVLFSLLTITTGLVWERRRGLLNRLVGAGVRGVEIIGGKMLTMVALTVLQQVFLILLGQLAFGVDYFNNVGAVALVVISLSVLAAAMGLLVTSLFRTEQAVIATTILAAQLLAALGGAWFPLEVTSSTFSRVAHYLPTAWVIDSFHGIIVKGWGVAEVASALTVTWAWAVFFFILAVWRFRVQ